MKLASIARPARSPERALACSPMGSGSAGFLLFQLSGCWCVEQVRVHLCTICQGLYEVLV